MFAKFRINIQEISKLKTAYPSRFIANGDKSQRFYQQLIETCKDTDGCINGAELSGLIFPFEHDKYDVFISYSHNDIRAAKYLYHYLTYKCEFRVFMDSTIWNSADGLLRVIDRKYCYNEEEGTYNYSKRNFSTSHVHTMLGMAMIEAIKRSELFLFIESDESISLKDGINNFTLSPWIYQEIQFANNLPLDEPDRPLYVRTRFYSTGGVMNESHLGIKYSVDTKEFHELSSDDLTNVILRAVPGEIHPLDSLYIEKGIIKV